MRRLWSVAFAAMMSIGLVLRQMTGPAAAQTPDTSYPLTTAGTPAALPPVQPPAKDIDLEEGATKTRPALDTYPRLGFGGSTDWTQRFSEPLNSFYDSYLESKKMIG